MATTTPSKVIDDLIDGARSLAWRHVATLDEFASMYKNGVALEIMDEGQPPDAALFRGDNTEIAPTDFALGLVAGQILSQAADTPSDLLGGKTPAQALRRIGKQA